MHNSKHEYIKKCITHKKPNVDKLPLNMTLPLSLTYSIPLPLWHQAPKPKGLTVGLQ